MSEEIFIEKQMLYCRPQKIPLFRLTLSGNHRYIDFKCSNRNMRRKSKEARSEQIRISTFFAMLLDEDRWHSGELFYTPKNHLPMFRMGYEGDLELAMVPESFRTDVLKEELDTNSVLVENANVETANFALLFEFDGDVKKIRHVLYNCAASRPSIESQTNEDEVEVQTETLSLTATPLANGYVKAKTGDSTTDAVYSGWYDAVYLPTESTDSTDTDTTGEG